jgi:hypothetical protein
MFSRLPSISWVKFRVRNSSRSQPLPSKSFPGFHSSTIRICIISTYWRRLLEITSNPANSDMLGQRQNCGLAVRERTEPNHCTTATDNTVMTRFTPGSASDFWQKMKRLKPRYNSEEMLGGGVCVQAGWNTSTVDDEREPSAWGCKYRDRALQIHGRLESEALKYGCEHSRARALECLRWPDQQQACPIVREGAPRQQIPNFLKI